MRGSTLEIENVHVTSLLVRDRVLARRGRHDVEVAMARELRELFRVEILRVQIIRAVAIGEKVDSVADPHWIGVVAVVPGELLLGVAREIDDADRLRAAAAIAPPLAALILRPHGREHRDRDLLVGHAFAVRRIRTGECTRYRKKLGHPSVRRDRPETKERIRSRSRERSPAGAEHDAFPIGRPPAYVVGAGMIGQPLRLTTGDGDNEDIRVPRDRRGVRDERSIRREVRIRFRGWRARETARSASCSRHYPQVAAILEGDHVPAHRGPAEKSRSLPRRNCGRCDQEKKSE